MSKASASVGLRLVEFSNSKKISYECRVDEVNSPADSPYDIIIGADLMSDIGIDLQFSRRVIVWDGVEVPMKDPGQVSEQAICDLLYAMHYKKRYKKVCKKKRSRRK